MLKFDWNHTSLHSSKIYIPHYCCCHCLHVAHCHRSHVAISHTLPTSNGCHLHAAVSHMSPSLACVAISRVVPMSDSCHLCITIARTLLLTMCHHRLHVTIACMSPSAAWCPQAVTVTHTSPLPACHHSRRHWPHGAHKKHLSPTCRCRHGCAAAIPNLKMLRVQFWNMMWFSWYLRKEINVTCSCMYHL